MTGLALALTGVVIFLPALAIVVGHSLRRANWEQTTVAFTGTESAPLTGEYRPYDIDVVLRNYLDSQCERRGEGQS